MNKDYKPVDKMKEEEEEEVEEGFSDEECAIVVADAAEVVPFDGVESGATVGKNDDNGYNSGGFRRVRVTAPCDLPSKYKLAVTTGDGETFDVIVPDNGVYKGQAFEADKWQPKRIEGRFGDNLCNCCGGEGPRWFAVACCCRGLAFGAIMEKLHLTWCANHTSSQNRSKNTFTTVAVLWFVFLITFTATQISRSVMTPSQLQGSSLLGIFLVFSLVAQAVNIYFAIIQTKTRMAFRFVYKIPGNCCTDCLVSFFCGCCSALQMYRHMKRSGDRPARFSDQGAVPAEIV